jgi:signal transduction histidine kinase
MAHFFTENLISVFFFYGLAFFSMGLAILIEVTRASELDFSHSLKLLAGFGLVHGSHEWFEMGLIIRTSLTGQVEEEWVYYLRLVLLGVSFLFLVAFGARLIIGPGKNRLKLMMVFLVLGLWSLGLVVIFSSGHTRAQLVAADVYTRYSLAIPGAALTTWGLLLQRRAFQKMGMPRFSLDVTIAALAFAFYGGIGQLFATPSMIFPSAILNTNAFLNWFGFPIQGFRALTAIIAAVFIIRSLRAFDEENQRRIRALSEAQSAERERLIATRAELLHRTVQAQELERRRIAHELHDETGQTLTALGLGLRGLTQTIPVEPGLAVRQAKELESLATDGIAGLQRMVAGLHPPQLDELGLLAALRWFAQEINNRYNLPVSITGTPDTGQVTDEIRLVLFRIVQEAITNTVRHAHASHVQVNLEITDALIRLVVSDDGQGFDVNAVLGGSERQCIGLLGMIERSTLVGGECQIRSMPGAGTTVEVSISRVADQAH